MIRKPRGPRREMRRRMHQRLRDQHRWLAAVLRGHYAYFGIPGNSYGLDRFRLHVMKPWRRVLLRRPEPCGRRVAARSLPKFMPEHIVMEAAEHRNCHDAAGAIGGTMDRRVLV